MLKRIDHIIAQILLADHYHIVRHGIIQVLVLIISINVFWDEPNYFIPERFTSWLLYFLFIDTAVYINMYVLVPRLLFKNRTFSYLLISSLFVLFMVLGIGFLQSGADEKGGEISTPPIIGIASGFLSFTLFLVGLTALQLLRYRIKNTSKIRALSTATMRMELAMLKNQINPHFLFNMLNNAHFMVEENPIKSSKILSRLKDLLFYQMEKGAKEYVSLTHEINFVKDYLALEKLRRDRFSFSIHLQDIKEIQIPPLLFIPFIENAVKHNPENDSHIDISIQLSEQTLNFTCINTLPKVRKIQMKGGLGLSNTHRRLDLLYGKQYQLDCSEKNQQFHVHMTLNI